MDETWSITDALATTRKNPESASDSSSEPTPEASKERECTESVPARDSAGDHVFRGQKHALSTCRSVFALLPPQECIAGQGPLDCGHGSACLPPSPISASIACAPLTVVEPERAMEVTHAGTCEDEQREIRQRKASAGGTTLNLQNRQVAPCGVQRRGDRSGVVHEHAGGRVCGRPAAPSAVWESAIPQLGNMTDQTPDSAGPAPPARGEAYVVGKVPWDG